MTEPMIQPTVFTVSFLPEGHQRRKDYLVTVEYAGNDRWAVRHYRHRLDGAGEWWYESAYLAADDDHLLFDLTTATELATRAARTLRFKGLTVFEVLGAEVQRA